MKLQKIALLLLGTAIALPSHADPNIWKELKKAAGEVITGASGEAEDTGKQILNGLLGGKSNGNGTGQKNPQTKSGKSTNSPRKNSSAQRTSTPPKPIGNGMIRNIVFDNAGMNEPFFRIDRDLKLSQTGFCYKGKITIATPNQQGKRLFCLVQPIIDGNTAADQEGSCSAIFAFEPTSSNYVAEVPFVIPTGWCGIDMNSNLTNPAPFKLALSVIDFSLEDPFLATELVTIDASRISLDHNRFLNDAAGTIFGDPESFIGGIFGTGDSVTHTCGSCDGTGLCPYCDGQGYIDPSQCRKCSSHPGICRRCNGSGTETSEVEINSIW